MRTEGRALREGPRAGLGLGRAGSGGLAGPEVCVRKGYEFRQRPSWTRSGPAMPSRSCATLRLDCTPCLEHTCQKTSGCGTKGRLSNIPGVPH